MHAYIVVMYVIGLCIKCIVDSINKSFSYSRMFRNIHYNSYFKAPIRHRECTPVKLEVGRVGRSDHLVICLRCCNSITVYIHVL